MQDDPLSRYLDSLESESSYRVDCVLKKNEVETTERVFLMLPDGTERGPYIRKFITRDSGMGGIYQRIYEAGEAGRTFRHIPKVLECYRNDHANVVVMEYVAGQTLADAVYARDPGVITAASLFPGLCDAVSEIHESFDPPIIHRDLKPSNIIVRDDVPYIIDFGIAREYRGAAEADTTHFGTRSYAPPEQFGYEQTTVRSDVYALGMLLYYLLVEQTPTAKVVQRGFHDMRIPEELRQVIEHATAFDPQRRYASAAELRAAFMVALASLQARDAEGAALSSSASGATTSMTSHGVPPRAVAVGVPGPVAPTPPQAAVAAYEPMPAHTAGRVVPEPASSVSPALPERGKVRNIMILVVLVFLVATSFRLALQPELATSMASYPREFTVFAYAVFAPGCMALIAFALMHKPRLRARFPRIAQVVGGREKWVVFFGLLALMVMMGIAGTLTGANT